MNASSQHSLAVLIWCSLLALKLVGLGLRWRRRAMERLGQDFAQELKRRGLASAAAWEP